MLFLASFVLKGRSQAALVTAAMAILGLVIPPAVWISAAAIVLVTLVHGPKDGMVTTAWSLLAAAIFSAVIFATPQLALMFVLMAWLPAWIGASVLRQTVSLAYSLQVLTAMVMLAVVMLYMLVPDLGEYWREQLNVVVSGLANQSDEFSLAELKKTEDWVIALIPGLIASSVLFGTMLSLFLGRWWQAVFYNPGGFRKEFHSLNLGKFSAMVALAVMMMTSIVDSEIFVALMVVVMVLYLIQALSLLHAVVRIRQLNAAWLFVIYVVMFFVPHLMLLLIMLSIADPWLNLRQRLAQLKS